MPIDETTQKPADEGYDQDPGKEEVNDTPGAEILVGRNRCPSRKASASRRIAVHRQAKHARRIETFPQNSRVSHSPGDGVLRANCQHFVGEAEAGLFAEVKGGVSVEYLQPGQEEKKHRNRPRPMGDTSP